MALLNRYRRKGGFEQLLKLIETSNPAKRDQLLNLIEQEDQGWAELLKMKALSIEKIFSWQEVYLKDIVHNLNPRVLGIALKGKPEAVQAKVEAVVPKIKWDEISDYTKQNFSAGEIFAAETQIVQSTREMNENGYIRFEDVDPRLALKAA
ncbi:MAG: FliG C-terminal domain-containing protein [Bdellovibrionota bacterium]